MSKNKKQKEFEISSIYSPKGDQKKAIKGLVDGLNQGLAYQTLLGVTGSGKTFTMANVIAKTNRPAIILAQNKTLAAQLYEEMKAFFPNNAVEYFVSYYDYYQPEAYVPSSDTFIDKDASINEYIEQMRLSATKAILERRDTIIIASVSCIYGLGDPNSYMKMLLHLYTGEIIDQRSILKRLAELQYKRNDVELTRGTFRARGDVIDIFPAESEFQVVRVELFDDKVESLSYFDPLTGAVLQKVERVTIYPKTHYVTPKNVIDDAIKYVKEELRNQVKYFENNDKLIERQRISERTQYDIEMMTELGYCSGIENYTRYLSGRNEGEPPPTLLEYLPADALIFIDESHVTIGQLHGMYRGNLARKENLVNYGFRLPSALDNRPLCFEEFERISPTTIYVSATPGDYELEKSDQVVEQIVRPTGLLDPVVEIRPAKNQVDDLLSEIRVIAEKGERILVTTLTKKMAEHLTDYLNEHQVSVRYMHSDIDTVERSEIIRDLRLGKFDVLVGINLLREGLDIPEVSLVAILDADKEGFLRGEKSLIQTIGRAARHINGKAILYADKETKSMKKAISETARRREVQIKYNKENGITPEGIKKKVSDGLGKETVGIKKAKKGKQKADINVSKLSFNDALKEIEAFEKEMLKASENLEFEEAASYRDKVIQLKEIIKKIG